MIAEGGCFCGALRYRVDGDPIVRIMCFCRPCQQFSGGNAAILMAMPANTVEYTKGSAKNFRNPENENAATRDFCAICGTHTLSRTPIRPDLVMVKVGTLDDPSVFGGPQIGVFHSESHSFHAVPAGVRVYEGRIE